MNTAPDHIDKYLRNELSNKERLDFEKELEQNSDLAQQFRSDQMITKGLNTLRQAELKARLEALPVSPSWYGVGQLGGSTIIKSAGVIITASLVGLSTWMWFNSEISEKPKDQTLTIQSEQFVFPEAQENILVEVPPMETKENPSIASIGIKKETRISTNKVTDEGEMDLLPSEPELVKEERVFIPTVELPALEELADERGISSSDAELPEMSVSDEVAFDKESKMEVETIYRKSAEIKYKYFDGKLYLYGDFKKTPYEILEIHGSSTKKLYLFHEAQYYGISVSDKVEELRPISDNEQIKELEIVRNNKL